MPYIYRDIILFQLSQQFIDPILTKLENIYWHLRILYFQYILFHRIASYLYDSMFFG